MEAHIHIIPMPTHTPTHILNILPSQTNPKRIIKTFHVLISNHLNLDQLMNIPHSYTRSHQPHLLPSPDEPLPAPSHPAAPHPPVPSHPNRINVILSYLFILLKLETTSFEPLNCSVTISLTIIQALGRSPRTPSLIILPTLFPLSQPVIPKLPIHTLNHPTPTPILILTHT